jgi:dolichol-phosphate mannosyltransferase
MIKLETRIGIIIPVYNNESTIRSLVSEIQETMQSSDLSFSIILVDDLSEDNSFDVIKSLLNANISGVRMKKNYGRSLAVLCGLQNIENCNFYCTIDADLEHPSTVIPYMVDQLISSSAEIVYILPKNEENRNSTRVSSRIFYKLSRLGFLPTYQPRSFTVFRETMRRYLLNYHKGLHIGVTMNEAGLPSISKIVEFRSRESSSYSKKMRKRLLIDFLMRYFQINLRIFLIFIGSILFLTSLISGLVLIFRFFGSTLSGWTSLILAIVFFGSLNILITTVIAVHLTAKFEALSEQEVLFSETI